MYVCSKQLTVVEDLGDKILGTIIDMKLCPAVSTEATMCSKQVVILMPSLFYLLLLEGLISLYIILWLLSVIANICIHIIRKTMFFVQGSLCSCRYKMV